MKKSIILYQAWGTILEGVSDEKAGKLIKMIVKYGFKEQITDSDDETINAIFEMVKDKIDEDSGKYQAKVERIAKARENRKHNENTLKSICNHNENTSVTDTVTDTVTVTVLPKGNKEKNIKRESRFAPPTLDEVKAYFAEKGINDPKEPQAFMDYYTSNGWKVGRNSMKDWKATIRTWINRGYNKPTKEKQRYDTSDRHVESI